MATLAHPGFYAEWVAETASEDKVVFRIEFSGGPLDDEDPREPGYLTIHGGEGDTATALQIFEEMSALLHNLTQGDPET